MVSIQSVLLVLLMLILLVLLILRFKSEVDCAPEKYLPEVVMGDIGGVLEPVKVEKGEVTA